MPLPPDFQAAQAAMSAQAAATGSDRKALVVLYLGGGIDCHNLITPRTGANRAAYTAARPTIQLADNPAQAINADWQWHPNVPVFKTLFDAGDLAVVRNIGPLVFPMTKAQYNNRSVQRPPQLYSHSDQRSLWEAGKGDSPAFSTGWLGRMMELLHPSFSPAATLPPHFAFPNRSQSHRGFDQTTLGLQPTGFPTRTWGSRVSTGLINFFDAQMQGLTASNPIIQEYADTHERALQWVGAVSGATAANTLTTTFPSTPLANQLRTTIALLQQRASFGHRRSTFFMTHGSYDTHADQLVEMAARLDVLNAAVAAFWSALVEVGLQNEVTLVLYSEFGRSLVQNGTGTDHAWGGHALVIGGAVNGGLYGSWPSLELSGPDMVDQRGYLLPTLPFESLWATLGKWMGVPDATANEVNPMELMLPNLSRFPTRDLGFLS